MPSVRRQPAMLRGAGIFISRRDGRRVLHAATALALFLLDTSDRVL
ncbi:hypothetical protein [Streptomyces sp. Act143]|nr:hypothetical protein [Streptomyces sp. Act143]